MVGLARLIAAVPVAGPPPALDSEPGHDMRVRIPYVHQDRDRHGNVRTYFKRPGGAKVRLRSELGTPAFLAEYAAAEAATAAPAQAQRNHPLAKPVPGTFRALAADYMASAAFLALDHRTQRVRRLIVISMLAEPTKPGADTVFADFPVAKMGRRSIMVLRDRKAALPDAANGRMKALRRIFAWAVEAEYPGVLANHARDISYIRRATLGHHTWTDSEIDQYEARWPIGTSARLALDVLLYTGLRRSDAVLVGRQHLRTQADGSRWLHLVIQKNRNRRPVTLDIPVLPVLERTLAASKVGDLTWLSTQYGRPFTAAGFGMRFRAWCDKAGLPHCSAHGLRKAGATRAAERGASELQLMSIYGWLNPGEAATYTRAASRRHMAAEAMPLLGRGNG